MSKESNTNPSVFKSLGDLLTSSLVDYANKLSLGNLQATSGQLTTFNNKLLLKPRTKYLQIALNNNLSEAREVIRQLPQSEKIIIEAGTPLIKIYGLSAVREIKSASPLSYVIADAKIADLARREVEMFAGAGANAVTCLGVAPLETIEEFIDACENYQVDSMLDMMNVDSAISVLKKLKKLPKVVILHRGVDETELSKEKSIPYYQIKQIKGAFDLIVAVAGGDTPLEIKSAFFNDADIVVVWKNFMNADENIGELAKSFLKEIR